jgi:hypothetical protein
MAKENNMQNGFLVTFLSSTGEACFLVTPSRVGQRDHSWYPWTRATFVGTAFSSHDQAQAALDRMKAIHAYMAPEVNGGLTKRLYQAGVVPASQVTGIELETL